ncbi:MAG: hypothetical protein ACYDB9_10510 [Gammaproteobacteria bacterium]
MSTDLREDPHTLAEQSPDNATWEEAQECLRFCQAVAKGKAAAKRGGFASDEDVHHVFNKYGAKT